MTTYRTIFLLGALTLIVGSGAATRATSDAAGTVTIIDVPGAANDSALDINAAGVIVGRYARAGQTHGFVRTVDGAFATLDVPGAIFTAATSINERGDIVGQFALPAAPNDRHGFLLKNGEFTFFDPAGSHFTNALAINDRGDIAGRYCAVAKCTAPGTGAFHAFMLRDGEFTLFDYPGAVETDAFGINNRGAFAGGYVNGQGQEQLFMLVGDEFTTLPSPPGLQVSLDKGSLNERGDLVGAYCTGPGPCLTTVAGGFHGFLMTPGVFTAIDIPGANGTAATGINARGDIVGTYSDGTRFHGFLISAPGARN